MSLAKEITWLTAVHHKFTALHLTTRLAINFVEYASSPLTAFKPGEPTDRAQPQISAPLLPLCRSRRRFPPHEQHPPPWMELARQIVQRAACRQTREPASRRRSVERLSSERRCSTRRSRVGSVSFSKLRSKRYQKKVSVRSQWSLCRGDCGDLPVESGIPHPSASWNRERVGSAEKAR